MKRVALVAALLLAAPAAAEWPLVWDFDGRGDEPVAARLGTAGASAGDLWVLVSSYVQGASGSPQVVLLRIAPDGGIVWTGEDPDSHAPQSLALRDDGATLVVGHEGSGIRVSAFSAGGTLAWTRSRSGVAPDLALYGPQASPIWDEAAAGGGAWRIPCGVGGDFAVLSFSATGDALPDVLWSLPAGEGRATSVLPRTGGGLLVAGLTENVSPPGWWTVALDSGGAEDWSVFDDGGTVAGIFTGAFLLSADPVRLWADDETHCGLFSLRLWALDAATGASLWDTTWPPNDVPNCDSFTPDSVVLAGDRILAAGVGNVAGVGASFDPIALSFDAGNGAHQWAQTFAGATTGIRAEVASPGGGALLASTLFPSPNPGPTPLWAAAWSRNGASCGAPRELISARVNAALPVAATEGTPAALLVGYGFNVLGSSLEDLIVQRLEDPCAGLFLDGFESGGTGQWSAAEP